MLNILFFNTKHALLPEVIAYTKYFESYGFGCEQADNIDIRDHSDYDVHWYMMGTDINIPFKLRPRILIHEYQSASVGDYAILKDLIKKFWPLVRKPDIRIFLNDKLTEHYGFKDNITYVCRDMGFYEEELNVIEKDIDFLYVGTLEKERDIDVFIDGFINDESSYKIYLLGNASIELKRLYYGNERVIFIGQVPYQEVYKYILRAKVCVNYIPDRFPYNIQTSTKLIEYAAYGTKFISTDYSWVREFEEKTESSFYKFKDDMSDFNTYDAFNFECTVGCITDYRWDKILERSDIISMLQDLNTRK